MLQTQGINSGWLECHQMPFMGSGDSQIFALVSGSLRAQRQGTLNNATSAISR